MRIPLASQKISSTIASAALLLAITLPLGGTVVGIEGGDQEAENRQLASFPAAPRSWRTLLDFPGGFDAWFSDHFAFRKDMVRWFGETRYFWLGVSPTPSVIVGRDAFLFYGADESVDDYANARPFTESELLNWRLSITKLRDYFQQRNIAYVFTIAPDKYRVYPEEFPDSVQQVNPTSRSDALYSAVSDTRVVADVRPFLSHAKAGERIYYLTDTHWNDRGAFAAYQTIIDAVRAQDPRVPPAWPRSDFDAGSKNVEGQDLAGMMGLSRVMHEDELPLVPRRSRQARVIEPEGWNPREAVGRLVTEIPGSTLPRAIVYRDSFTDGLVPFLSEHFSHVLYVWQNDVEPEIVLAEHADVVIQEIVGRHLYSFVPSPKLVPNH